MNWVNTIEKKVLAVLLNLVLCCTPASLAQAQDEEWLDGYLQNIPTNDGVYDELAQRFLVQYFTRELGICFGLAYRSVETEAESAQGIEESVIEPCMGAIANLHWISVEVIVFDDEHLRQILDETDQPLPLPGGVIEGGSQGFTSQLSSEEIRQIFRSDELAEEALSAEDVERWRAALRRVFNSPEWTGR